MSLRALWLRIQPAGEGAVEVGSLSVPVIWRGDVLVVGGDLPGAAAALEAAKHGAKTALICEEGFLGGIVTAGLLCRLGRVAEASPNPGGFAADLIYRLERLRGRRGAVANPEALKASLDDMLLSVGVDLFYHTKPVGALSERGLARGALAATKRGYVGFYAKRVVDATPEGRIEASLRGGLPRRGRRRLLVCSSGLLEGAKVEEPTSLECPEPLDLLGRRVWLHPGPSEEEALLVVRRVREFDPADPLSLSVEAARGRWAVVRALEVLRNRRAELSKAYVAASSLKPWLVDPAEPAIRPRLRPLRPWEVAGGEAPEGSVTFLLAEILRADPVGGRLEILLPERPFGLPYGWLLPSGIEGLLCAPPIWVLSSSPLVWVEDPLATALAGQVAGLAASLSAHMGLLPHKLPLKPLKERLKEEGLLPHPP